MVARRSCIAVFAIALALAACGGGSPEEPVPVDDGAAGNATPDAPAIVGNTLDDDPTPADPPPGGAVEVDANELPVFADDASVTPGPVPDAGTNEPPGAIVDDGAALRELESRIATDFTDTLDHESWICTGETRRVEYRFAVASDGTRRGAELDGRGVPTSTEFGWTAIGADTLLLDYRDVGRQIELGSILFADDASLRTDDGVNGPLECRRQRYVDGAPTRDVAVTAPADVDRNVEAAMTLVGRIETSRTDDGGFDHWYCEIADGGAVGYVFAGPGVLDPDRRAIAFDIERQDLPVPGEGEVEDGDPGSMRPDVDPEANGGRTFRWLATDGTTLLLVPLGADVALGTTGVETTALEDIVFLVDDAFTARRTDDALLQCLRDGDV